MNRQSSFLFGQACQPARSDGNALTRSMALAMRCFGVLLISALLGLGNGQAQTAARPAATAAATQNGNGEGKPAADPAEALEQARQRLDAIQKQLRTDVADDALTRMRADAQATAARAEQIAADLAPLLTSVQERLKELGTAPTGPGASEEADLAEQRTALTKRRDALDAQQKLSRLLSVEAEQIAADIAVQRKQRFQSALADRSATPLAGPFWRDLTAGFERDRKRVWTLFDELATAAARTPGWVWFGAFAVMAGAYGLRRWIDALLLRISSTKVPPGRLRRSTFALGEALAGSIVPGAIAYATYVALTWAGPLYAPTGELMSLVIGAMLFGGLVAGIGHALLSPKRPTWRLLTVPDPIPARALPLVRIMAVWLVLLAIVDKIAQTVNTTLETSVAIDCLFSLMLIIVLAIGKVRIERERRKLLTRDDGEPVPVRPLWMVVLTTLIWVVLGVSLLSLGIGYLALGNFLIRQLAWVLIVAGFTYLVIVFLNDLLMTVLAREPEGKGDRKDDGAERLPDASSSRRQAAVLAAGLMRIVLCVVAVAIVMAPFGEGPLELLQRADRLRDGLALGELRIRPLSLLQAGLVLVLGLMAVRGLQRWMLERYLPTTRIEQGMHTSVTTLLGYIGAVAVIAVALSELGFSLERIAWMASALSVGIGFGLQAVVQNFVSGLILLAERPVKVGDWVSLGGAEGDIRRINVRATEIQLGDRSTVIVPNSEFITKTVRNVTRADPMGLVQFKFPMPLDSDAERVREAVLQAFAEHPDVLETPAPKVFLDGIDGNNLIFNANASVGSPRQSYGVKSAILFDLLARLRKAGLPLAAERTMVLRERSEPTASELPGPKPPSD